METSPQGKLTFHGVDIVNLTFSSFQQYDNKTHIDLNIAPKVFFPDDNRSIFKIIMDVSIVSKDFFELKFLAIGTFQLDTEISEAIKKSFINVNAPAIMFPYVRSFISTFTANIGTLIGSLRIPAQFFQGDLEELNESILE